MLLLTVQCFFSPNHLFYGVLLLRCHVDKLAYLLWPSFHAVAVNAHVLDLYVIMHCRRLYFRVIQNLTKEKGISNRKRRTCFRWVDWKQNSIIHWVMIDFSLPDLIWRRSGAPIQVNFDWISFSASRPTTDSMAEKIKMGWLVGWLKKSATPRPQLRPDSIHRHLCIYNLLPNFNCMWFIGW